MPGGSLWRRIRDAVGIAVLLAVSTVAAYAAGGTTTALPHAFYVPIVIAAACFGVSGAVVAAAAAGILCGPVMPQDVAAGVPQETLNWLMRAGFFLVVGVVAALVTDQLRKGWSAQHAVAEERADLASARPVLLQVVSHEIRTLLTVLKGGMELLQRHETFGPQSQKMVPAVVRSLDRLEDLAEVVIAAVDTDSIEERRVHRIRVGDALQSLSPQLDPSRVHISGGDAEVVTEPENLRLIVRCLVENALKFSPDGTPVEVSARVSRSGVLVEVRDRGAGIPDDFTTGEFQIMRQGDASTTREKGGLGLGLYATRRLVDRLGGELMLRRDGAHGTSAPRCYRRRWSEPASPPVRPPSGRRH